MRYRRSVIGPFWISLSIGAFVVGLAFIYSQLFALPFQEYLNRLAAGYVLWHYLSAIVNEGSHAVTESASNLKSVHLPTSILAARVTARNIIVLLHNLAAVLPLMVLFGGHQFNANLLWAVAGMGLYAILGMFVVLTLGPICARYRDLPEVLKSVTQLCFFLTPVIWPADRLQGHPEIVLYNPFYHLIELVRAPMLGSPPTTDNLIAAGLCIGFFIVTSFFSAEAARQRLPLWV